MKRILGVVFPAALLLSSGAWPQAIIQTLVDAGPCKLYQEPRFSENRHFWQGECKDGLAEGPGVTVMEAQERVVAIQRERRSGRSVGAFTSVTKDVDGRFYRLSCSPSCPPTQVAEAISRDQIPDWARPFVLGKFAFPPPGTPAAAVPAPAVAARPSIGQGPIYLYLAIRSGQFDQLATWVSREPTIEGAIRAQAKGTPERIAAFRELSIRCTAGWYAAAYGVRKKNPLLGSAAALACGYAKEDEAIQRVIADCAAKWQADCMSPANALALNIAWGYFDGGKDHEALLNTDAALPVARSNSICLVLLDPGLQQQFRKKADTAAEAGSRCDESTIARYIVSKQ